MRPARPTPTGVERTFGADELIVSKTDPKGIITYANRTFHRVCGFSEAELIGQPHNIIRHPDMPRCVFKLMWDRISAGEELFAYVKNLARDGAHYWVYAHITPSFGRDGTIVAYHSNRRSPDPSAVPAVEAVYAELLTAEALHSRPAEALAAGTDRLRTILDGSGATYDEWVWHLTNTAERDTR